jgi:hypothetical protein
MGSSEAVERAVHALKAVCGQGNALDEEREPAHENYRTCGLAPCGCGSLDCEGCCDVGAGRKIHPPKIGEDYRKWLERWKAKGKPQ